MNFVNQHGQVKRSDVVELWRISEDQATRLLARLVVVNLLRPDGEKRGRLYYPVQPTGPKGNEGRGNVFQVLVHD